MTVYGWDASHFDGLLTTAILAEAKAEGITFFSHKIGEGLSDTEGTMDDTALAAARDAGMPFLGGYVIPRTLDAAAQVDYWWQVLNGSVPWWHDHPGWFNQVDLERWAYDAVSAATGIDCAKRWRDKTGRQTILYASHGQYGDQLAAWDGPTWNADYVSRPAGSITAMYPGDDWQPLHGTWRGGWAPYSGRTPTFLQYTSSATIAGLTTCDANAYQGTLDQLRAFIGGHDMDQTEQIKGAAAYSGRTVGDAFADLTNLRDWLYGVPGTKGADGNNPPPTGSRAALLAQVATTPAAALQATQDQVDAAVAKTMNDPAWLAKLGAAVASHIHVS